MEKLTKNELQWLMEAARLTAGYYEQRGKRASNKIERNLAALRSEQLTGIADRLQNALGNSDKRIAIS